MKLADALIVWTPDTEKFSNHPTRGTIAVTTMPESKELNVHPAAAGVCEPSWIDRDHNGRQERLQQIFTYVIHRDGIQEDAARKALSIVDDVDLASLDAVRPQNYDPIAEWVEF